MTKEQAYAAQHDSVRQGFTKKRIEDFVNGGPVDAIVIGSGLGGLTTAAMLSRAGWRVLVLEQHDVLGGTTHTFVEEGRFEFGTGLHYVGGALARSKLLDALCDGQLEWAEMDPDYDHAELLDAPVGWSGGRDAVYMCKGFKQLRSHLCGQFPKEKDAIYKYFDEIFQASKGAKAMIMMKIMPNFIYSKCAEYFDKLYGEYGTRSVIDVMQECGLSNETIGMLTYNWGDFGTLPSKAPFLLHALHIMHWMKGGWFPVHGPEQIAITILPTIEKPGGKCFVNARVSEIVLDKSGGVEGVLMNKGLFIPTTRVVSGVGAYNTYTKLLSDKATLPPQIRDTRNALTSQELPLGGTMMSLFIGLEGTVESLEVPKHNKWVFPTWDHDANQKRQDDEGLDAPFPVVYLSFSCAKDPKWAEKYPDTCVAEVLAPIPYSMFEEFEKSVHKKRNDSYDALKEVFQEKMMDVVYKRLPQFKGKVKYVNLGSPLTNNHYYNTHKGEVYALDHSLVRFSVHNQKNRLRPTTEIRGLYLTGQDVFMCGIMTAMYSGVMTVASMSWMALFKNLDILLRRVPSVYGETRVKSDGNEYGVLKDSAVFKILMVVIFAMLFRALLVG